MDMKWILRLVLLASVSGCGLSDYEKRIDAQRARVKAFDDLNGLLDGPIAMPMKPKAGGQPDEKENAWPFDVFLRLPKGYTIDKERLTTGDGFNCFRYSGGSEGALNIFIAAAGVIDPDKDAKAADNVGKYSLAAFQNHLIAAVWKYHAKEFKTIPPQPNGKKQEHRGFDPILPYPDAEKTTRVVYRSSQLYTDEWNRFVKDKNAFEFFFFERDGKQVGIVVHRPFKMDNPEVTTKSIDACLGSLDVSSEAATKRALYKKHK
jgi:hypothetical protein